MNSYILTEGRNFQIFWKENYAIALDGCCLLTKKNVEHGIEHDIDSAYGVCKHLTFLNFTAGLINTLQFKQIMNLTICYYNIL